MSSLGGCVFQKSLLPERDQDLVDERVAEPRDLAERAAVDVLELLRASHTSAAWRLAVVHTPITEPWSDSLPCGLPRSSIEMGTWMAIECTFSWAVALTPSAGLAKAPIGPFPPATPLGTAIVV